MRAVQMIVSTVSHDAQELVSTMEVSPRDLTCSDMDSLQIVATRQRSRYPYCVSISDLFSCVVHCIIVNCRCTFQTLEVGVEVRAANGSGEIPLSRPSERKATEAREHTLLENTMSGSWVDDAKPVGIVDVWLFLED
jgi:hypothetical protein